jgi:hypothetical protein
MTFSKGVCSLSLMALAADAEAALPYVVGVLLMSICAMVASRVIRKLKELKR